MNLARKIITNAFRDLGFKTTNQLQVEEKTAGMNDESFLEWLGINKKQKNAMSEITYFTCLKMLSETLAKMPVKFYQKTPTGTVEAELDKMAYLICKRPNEYMTPTTLWNATEINRNHYGNAYIWKQMRFTPQKYGGIYEPVALWLMPSENVRIIMDDEGIFGGAGKVWYWYTDKYSGKSYVFGSSEVMHFKTSHCLDGICGIPIQQILKEQVEGNLSAQSYQNSLYETGMTAKAVLEYTGDIDGKSREKLRAAFEEFGNGAKNTGRIMPVPLGFKLTPLDVKLTDAQFFELRKYSSLQIAAAFGVKPNQINDYEKSSYANSEMQQLSFLVDTMLFILKGYEEEINYKCLTPDQEERKYYYKFNERAVLRTDSKTQTEILAAEVNAAIRSPNEARRKEDLPDKPGGDDLLINGAYVPLQLLIKKAENEVAAGTGNNSGGTPPGTG